MFSMLVLIVTVAILALSGVVYGITSVLLHGKRMSLVCLNLLVIFMSYDVFVNMYVLTDLWAIYPQMLFTNWVLSFAYGPLLFLFLLFRFTDQKLKVLHFIYFLPFIFMLLFSSPFLFVSAEDKLSTFKQMQQFDFTYLTNDKEWIFHSVWSLLFIVLSMFSIKKAPTDESFSVYVKIRYVLLFILITGLAQLLYLILYFKTPVEYQQNNLYVILNWLSVFLIRIFVVVKKNKTKSLSL